MQGVVGAFHEIDTTVAAIEDLKKKKLGEVTVYSPTIRHELEHAIEGLERWMESEFVVELDNARRVDFQLGSGLCIQFVTVRNQSIQSIVSAGPLDHDEDSVVAARFRS